MKCVSLTQPWATLAIIGAKGIETRSWKTQHRGKLGIHAAKGLGPAGGLRNLRNLLHMDPFFNALVPLIEYNQLYMSRAEAVDQIIDCLPLGAVLGTVELYHCSPIFNLEGGVPTYISKFRGIPPHEYAKIPESDLPFGDYTNGRYAWFLRDRNQFRTPIPATGHLSLWDWEA